LLYFDFDNNRNYTACGFEKWNFYRKAVLEEFLEFSFPKIPDNLKKIFFQLIPRHYEFY